MKIGLVLEGGGMRGLYTVGVLEALSLFSFRPDYLIGVSAGAANGANFLAGQKGRGLRVNIDYISDKKYLSFSNFVRTGSVFGFDLIYDEIPNRLDPFDFDAFQRNPCEYKVGVTNAQTGKPEYFEKESMKQDLTVLRASSSIPMFAPAVSINGTPYYDGGTSDPIPVLQAFKDGCDKVVIVLTRARTYQKSQDRHFLLAKILLRQYPHMISLLQTRHLLYNQTLEYIRRLEKEHRAVVIAPDKPLGIDRFEKNRDKLMQVYELGFLSGNRFLKDSLSNLIK